MCFSVKFPTFSRTLFLTEHLQQLLLTYDRSFLVLIVISFINCNELFKVSVMSYINFLPIPAEIIRKPEDLLSHNEIKFTDVFKGYLQATQLKT